ncbi:NYN domain-containing protein [Paraburkholderia sp. MMS20-SJTR3]|uniref:NYN domain-containing protein n=1 Tax=Paraburkholderia sejongensis TaxID=2886946 RepID=A0ABS8JW80_9BURK|nr:NYN domain-containing protein [Paraburkholderia sp. MMS20-SJTR3]MCC8394160.1 NYN domain-containing protein [Paraburkholderia sp. MMS20-SJTR3]
MAASNENVSMALFCDFENVALGVRDAKYDKFDIKLVLERLLLKGSIVVKKAYCDWDRYKSFKGAMHEANFELIEIPHVRQSGKNSADIRLVVDALDLCYTKSHVNTFVIISGDSDFSPLVSKLRENAKQVIGVGVQQSTSDLLIANCDEFFFYDDLVRESQRAVARRESSRQQPNAQQAAKRAPDEEKARPKEDLEKRRSKAVEIAVQTFDALASERGDSGKIWASVLKNAIKRRKPDFNETYYGFRAFGNLLEEAQARGLLEFGRDEKSGAYVYRSTAVSVAGEAPGETSNEAVSDAANEAANEAASEAANQAANEAANETVNEPAEARTGEPAAAHSYEAQTAQAASFESGGKHKSRRKDRGNRKAARAQQDAARDESAREQAAHRQASVIEPVVAAQSEAATDDERAEHVTRVPQQQAHGETHERRPSAAESAGDLRQTRSSAAPRDVGAEPAAIGHEDEAAPLSDVGQAEQPQPAKKRASRKTAAKKVKKSPPRTIDEVPEIAAPPEDGTSAASAEQAPAAAKKTARKTPSRGRRPRKAGATDNAE